MNTLIIPCAGKSSRFPNMKPKWMLTHPDGDLMIKKSLRGINTEIFDRIIVTIVKPHDEQYDASLVLKQEFNDKIEICILDDFTSCAAETIYLTIKKMNITGAIVIKDSDNFVQAELPSLINNMVVGYDLKKHPDVSNIPGKSFLLINKQNIVDDIIEKNIVSNIICLGIYCFKDVSSFICGYTNILNNKIKGEIYISHVISYLLSTRKFIFTFYEASYYEDWGTIKEWEKVQKRFRTYFVDFDGVLIKNSGKHGRINWDNNSELIIENIKTLKNLQDLGAQIVITSARPEKYRLFIQKVCCDNGVFPYAIILGLNHSTRVLINDFAKTNPYPSAMSFSIPRNCLLTDYLS